MVLLGLVIGSVVTGCEKQADTTTPPAEVPATNTPAAP